jgi:cyanophycinase-like exopeptidase
MAGRVHLGKIVLFGSGETSATGRAIHDRLMAELTPPVVVAILETPAGFQPNSEHVAREVGEFMTARLKNYRPDVRIIPARKKESRFSPDDALLLEPLLDANYIFLGPGSPTYTARNLEGTLALEYLLERHKMGAVLCFASAATLAVGAKVLPVYEIFKAGSDLYWADGLNVFGAYGLDLAIVPHWNNTDGGIHLDTSRCFMGQQRLEQLGALLPASTVLLGIDEHTALIFDFQQARALVAGKGTVTIASAAGEKTYSTGDSFALHELGPYRLPPDATTSRPPVRAEAKKPPAVPVTLPPEVAKLINLREDARRAQHWAEADALRQQIAGMGFEVQDTPQGPRWSHSAEKAVVRAAPAPGRGGRRRRTSPR